MAHERDLPALSAFLEAREWQCVSFSGHLRESGEWRPPRRYRKRVFLHLQGERSPSSKGGIQAAVLQTANGFVYPLFATQGPPPASLTDSLVSALLAGRGRVTTLMGMRESVQEIEGLLPSLPQHAIDYDLLYLPPDGNTDQLSRKRPERGLVVRRATAGDVSILLPLQEAYEREEVLLPGRSIDRGLTLRMLQQSIRRQVVVLAMLQGRVVAKAATNARGGRYDQLGGVFTVPDLRRRGLGTIVVASLTRLLRSEGRGASLFVKKDNAAARELYLRLGFLNAGSLRISYFS